MSAITFRPTHAEALSAVRIASAQARPAVAYTIGTLVNDHAQYTQMRATFEAGGFTTETCEYLYIDNTGSEQTCAFKGLNAILSLARGRYVILCHQDVRLEHDDRAVLERRLAQLSRTDPNWAVAGNAGGVAPGQLAMRISDPHGRNRSVGTLPARVMSLDENFILVRGDARVGFSVDLEGFHFYGSDICLVADLMGYSAYVIDFHLVHLSAGNKGTSFAEAEEAFRQKWSHALRPRWLQSTCALVHLSGGRVGRLLGQLAETSFAKISRRLPGAQGWTAGPIAKLGHQR